MTEYSYISEDEKPLSDEERQRRVYNLTLEEEELKRQKKTVNQSLNFEIKRVRKEKEELIKQDVKMEQV